MTLTPDPRIGTDLGPYHIEAVVGRGGMGVVYRATDTKLDRPVALKLLAPDFVDDEAFRARFLRESKMAAAIDHPNIIPIYEAGALDGTYFLAMRYVDGTDLASRLRAGALEPRTTVALLAQVAGALDAAHAAGLVHRDVKPANLLLASGHGVDRADHVYLTDFGLTKQRGSDTALTRTGSFLGTLEYVAPEQIEGKPLDGRADQYALAAIAVECLTGESPFPRDSDLAIVNAHLRDAPPSIHERRPDLLAAVDAVIARGLAKDPAARYPDCRTFVDDLREALGVTGSQPRPVPATATSSDRRPLVAAAVAIIGLVAVAAIAFASLGGGGGVASASPSLGALASASPVASIGASSPTDDVFPNADEAALLETLPGELRSTCERGPYNVVEAGVRGFGQAAIAPSSSVTCTYPVGAARPTVIVRRFGRATQGVTTDDVVSFIIGSRNIRPGDCASQPNAAGRWQLAEQDAGAIVCYTDTGTGDAVIYWSYQGEGILVKAIDQRGESAELYAIFQNLARFIAP